MKTHPIASSKHEPPQLLFGYQRDLIDPANITMVDTNAPVPERQAWHNGNQQPQRAPRTFCNKTTATHYNSLDTGLSGNTLPSATLNHAGRNL